MSEGQVTTRLLSQLRSGGWFYKASDRFRAGIPDIIGVAHGTFIAVEVKVGNNKPTDLQRFEIAEINKNGGFACVVTHVKHVYRIQDKDFATPKDTAEWILKQSLLDISLRVSR